MFDHITRQLFRKYYNYNESKTVLVPANVTLVVHVGHCVTCPNHQEAYIPKQCHSQDVKAFPEYSDHSSKSAVKYPTF